MITLLHVLACPEKALQIYAYSNTDKSFEVFFFHISYYVVHKTIHVFNYIEATVL